MADNVWIHGSQIVYDVFIPDSTTEVCVCVSIFHFRLKNMNKIVKHMKACNGHMWDSRVYARCICYQITNNSFVPDNNDNYNNKSNIKAPYFWPIVKWIRDWWVDSSHKGSVMRKAFLSHDISVCERQSCADETMRLCMWIPWKYI